MGVDTKALLKGKIDLVQLANDLVELYGTDRYEVTIRFTFMDDYYRIRFYQRGRPVRTLGRIIQQESEDLKLWFSENKRDMSVHYGCKGDYAKITTDDCTYISLGCWGESVEIMECLLRKYGGWIMRNDSTDDWEEFAS